MTMCARFDAKLVIKVIIVEVRCVWRLTVRTARQQYGIMSFRGCVYIFKLNLVVTVHPNTVHKYSPSLSEMESFACVKHQTINWSCKHMFGQCGYNDGLLLAKTNMAQGVPLIGHVKRIYLHTCLFVVSVSQ